jgi:hypothetical protein
MLGNMARKGEKLDAVRREMLRWAGAKGRRTCQERKLGIHAPENRGKGLRKQKELKIGVFSPNFDRAKCGYAQPRAAKVKGGRTAKRKKVGVFAPEHQANRSKWARAGRLAQKEKGLGINAPEMRTLYAVLAGHSHKRNGTGIFAPGVHDKTLVANRQYSTGLWDPDVKQFGLHTRWHVNRGIVKPDCKFCVSDEHVFRQKPGDAGNG